MNKNLPLNHSWLLCIHNIPPKPSYLRTKAARRLAALGAVPLKNAVYLLPDGERQRDSLLWLSHEIEEGGGRAFVCRASFDLGENFMADSQITDLFNDARSAQYRLLFAKAQPAFQALQQPHGADETRKQEVATWLAELRQQFEAIAALDFFNAPGRDAIEGILAETERWLRLAANGKGQPLVTEERLAPQQFQGKTWVTRPGVHVDRIASAWFIRRFIDASATIRYSTEITTNKHIHFDMVGGAFSHEGTECTFEVMVRRFGFSTNRALAAVCSVVHDIDFDEPQPARPETAGIAALMLGITLHVADDDERLKQGFQILDALLEFYMRAAPAPE